MYSIAMLFLVLLFFTCFYSSLALKPQTRIFSSSIHHMSVKASSNRKSISNRGKRLRRLDFAMNDSKDTSLLSSIALVSGTCVGAGILALPATAAPSGFIPSSFALIGSWIIMCSTGILMAEASCNLQNQSKNQNKGSQSVTGILSITKQVLGNKASIFSSIVYMINNYILLTAYIAQAGSIINNSFGIHDVYIGPLFYGISMGLFMTFSSKSVVEYVNNLLFGILLITFSSLLIIGFQEINLPNLFYVNYNMVWTAIPVMLVALVYHNIIPSICLELNYSREKIVKSIVLGSFIPLVMFILWDQAILGVGIDPSPAPSLNLLSNTDGTDSTLISQSNSIPKYDPIAILDRGEVSSVVIDYINIAVNVFGMSAITTSFIGFVISLVDFYQELLSKVKDRSFGAISDPNQKSLLLYSCVVIPPLVIAITDPTIFLIALDYAGTYGVSVLFGFLPILVVSTLRNNVNKQELTVPSSNTIAVYERFLPGGSLFLNSLFASLVLCIGIRLFRTM